MHEDYYGRAESYVEGGTCKFNLYLLELIIPRKAEHAGLIVCVCIIYSYNNEGTIGYKISNTNIIKNKNGLTD